MTAPTAGVVNISPDLRAAALRALPLRPTNPQHPGTEPNRVVIAAEEVCEIVHSCPMREKANVTLVSAATRVAHVKIDALLVPGNFYHALP